MRHLVVVSDVHLCELEPSEGLWMRYRQRPYSPSPELAKMVDRLREEVRPQGGSITLVLNGDTFDFDSPRVVNGRSEFHDEPRDERHSVPVMEAILRDNHEFVEALGRLLVHGHRVVFVTGNHDAHLNLPAVRAVVRQQVLDAAARASTVRRSGVAERLEFRGWFYKTEDGVIVEHGHQYDTYCSFHYPLTPFGPDGQAVAPTFGSLATRWMTSRMGYFNPHVDETYEQSVVGYARHWAQHYLGTDRDIARPWLRGALKTFFSLVGQRDPGSEARRQAHLAAAVAETGADAAVLQAHAGLFASPVEVDDRVRAARELWIDRVAGTFGALAFAGSWLAFAPPSLWAGALAGGAALAAWELLVPKYRAQDRWTTVDDAARRIAGLHGARAVVMGHTHHPHASWKDGVLTGNSGSWAAAYYDVECQEPVFPHRPLIWLRGEGEALTGGLSVWTGSGFERVANAWTPEHEPARVTAPLRALRWQP